MLTNKNTKAPSKAGLLLWFRKSFARSDSPGLVRSS